MSEYCDVAPGHEFHGPYHDTEYGFPIAGDAELFERLILEINQAGLSWLTILKKRAAFRKAYHGFKVDRVALRKSHGSFRGWLDAHHPRPKSEWVKLFRQTFRFTGGEIVGEFLMSTGYLPGAHRESCPVYREILTQEPAWRRITLPQ